MERHLLEESWVVGRIYSMCGEAWLEAGSVGGRRGQHRRKEGGGHSRNNQIRTFVVWLGHHYRVLLWLCLYAASLSLEIQNHWRSYLMG